MKFKCFRTHISCGPYGVFSDEVIELRWLSDDKYMACYCVYEANWKMLLREARRLKANFVKFLAGDA